MDDSSDAQTCSILNLSRIWISGLNTTIEMPSEGHDKSQPLFILTAYDILANDLTNVNLF